MDEPNSIQKQINLLLSAYGYNLYKNENRARADDLLVRQRACSLLGNAATHLTRLATDYARQFIPPSSREHPFPPAERMAQLREIKALHSEIALLESRIRGMSVPTQDSLWQRFRLESTTLEQLLRFDYQLIAETGTLSEFVGTLTANEWTEMDADNIRAQLQSLEAVARARESFLTSPF